MEAKNNCGEVCMCKRSGEFVNHLLIHCEVARALWSVILNHFDVTWVKPGRVIVLLCVGEEREVNCSIMVMDVWRMAPLCVDYLERAEFMVF
jgi:hypothetical protein